MEREGSLPWLQEPATSSYPETVHSIPVSNFISWRSILILLSHPHFNWPLSLRFRHPNLAIVSLFPRTCCMPRWSHFSWVDYLIFGEECQRSYYFYSIFLKAHRKVERIAHTDSRQHYFSYSSIINFIRSMCRTSGVDKRSWPPATR